MVIKYLVVSACLCFVLALKFKQINTTLNKGHLFVVGRICWCFSSHDFSLRAAWVRREANGRPKQL